MYALFRSDQMAWASFAVSGRYGYSIKCCGAFRLAHFDCKAFQWTSECDLAFRRLKLQLAKAPVMVPPNWGIDFHVFVDASDVAIGSVLMQEQLQGWFRPLYYRRRLSAG